MEFKPDEIVIVINRYKLRQNAFTVIGKKNVVVSVESHYARRRAPDSVLKSVEQRAVPGCAFCVPWAETISGLVVNVHSIHDRLTCFIGQAEITTDCFGIQPSNLDLYIKNCGQIVGQIALSVAVRHIFADGSSKNGEGKGGPLRIPEPPRDGCVTVNCTPTPQGFRFNRLSRPVNWERLRSINLRRVVENADPSPLLYSMDDILTGDVRDEEVDPRLAQALKVAQLTAQYIVASNQLLQTKQEVIQKGIAAFDEEEERLDLELSKLRARCRARQREADDLDALELRYSKLLTYCDPKLARAHREEERRESRRMARRQRISKQPIPVVQSDSKCRDSDDCPSDGSGAIEDSEDEMGHKYRMKEVNSDEHIDGHTHLVNESSYSVSAVPPKLLALKHPAKEEASSRFNVLKKPDEPYETAMPWIIAKNVTGREPKVSAKEEVITGDASFVSPKIAMSGTMGSTGMSIDSLQRIAADIEVLETVVAWRSASPAFCQLPQAGATSEPVVEVENISIPKIGNFSAINLDKNLDLLSTVSPLSTDLLAGSTDSLPITKNHPIAQSTLQITELGDESLDYYPFTPEDIVDCECVQIDRQIEAKKYLSGTMVDSVVRQQTEVIAEPHVLERSKTGTYGTDRWSKSDRFRAELDEHNYLFEHPHKSAEFTLGVIDNELAIGQRVILEQRSDVIDDIEDFEGETPGDIDRRPVATDMLSPLGVVGTAVLRKRAATGTAGGLSMASDEDDRVLMGTASLHRPYDSTGHLSAETNETSVTSTSNLDLSEDQELTLSVPIQQPPAPPSKQGPAVDACTPALSTLDTEDSSVGFDLTASENIQSFGEASSDVGLSQGFVANLTARYLNPDILGGAADATTRSTHYDDAAADEDVIDALRWCPGRASLDLIETAMAIDAYVSSVRIEPPFLQSGNIQKMHLRFNFLEATSATSATISASVRSSGSSISLNFGAHIEFDRKGYKLLSEEIEKEGDELALQIIVFGEVQRSDDADDVEDKVIGIASVNLWFMIEDSCAIVLQEVDVIDVETGVTIGSVVTDVRGHLCLLECA